MSQKPNVLIFGGMFGPAQAVTEHLVPPLPAEPLVAHIRIIDKYSVSPPTTYVGKDFLELLAQRKDIIEYKQANLIYPAVAAQCFDLPAPNGQPYTHVIDLSGNLSSEHPAPIQIVQTLNVGVNIAREAQKHNVKAIVRLQPPYYHHTDVDAKYKEDDQRGWTPQGPRGVWWHETLRAIGSIPGLPFVVVRCGFGYGQHMITTEATSGIVLGLVYKHMNRDLKFNWSPKLRRNTIHNSDLGVALWIAAEWMASTGREAANSIAGVNLPPTGDSEVPPARDAISSGGVTVPLFNVVDGADTNQEMMSGEVAKVYGIQVAFHEGEEMGDMTVEELTEYLNDLHVGEWSKIITESNPPVPHTPLSPYAYSYQVEEHGCALDGTKFKTMFSFQPKYPRFDASSIRTYIDWCRKQGIWPESPLYTA